MTRPELRPVPLRTVWPPHRGRCYATMSQGQWDGLLQGAYDVGFVLIELDEAEEIVATYHRDGGACISNLKEIGSHGHAL